MHWKDDRMTLRTTHHPLRAWHKASLAAVAAVGTASVLALGVVPAGATVAATATTTPHARSVTEPTVPGTCQPVPAQLAKPGNELFSSTEESAPPDTSRIQAALNSCAGTGKAVELTASGGNSAFLSAPLTINKGEVLLVDAGVRLTRG